MKDLQEKLAIVVHYMNNLNEFAPEFWKNLKATKLKDKTEEYIDDIGSLIEEWVNNGKDAFYEKHEL